MVKRNLKYNYARPLCPSQHYGLATICEENEYAIAQSLCANNTMNILPSNYKYKYIICSGGIN